MKEHTIRTIRSLLESPGYSEQEADRLERHLNHFEGVAAVILITDGYLVAFSREVDRRRIAQTLSKRGFKTTTITQSQRIAHRITHKLDNGQWEAQALIATWND